MSPFEIDYAGHMDAVLLQGCCREAERADIVASYVESLRASLPETYHAQMKILIEEIRVSARILRDLADHSQVHLHRVQVMLKHLNAVLPCLQRTLKDITKHYNDRSVSKEIRWRRMYHQMKDEVGGLPLPQRFLLYNAFLQSLKQMLMRSPNFDFNTLETMRTRIMQFRESRGIAPPTPQVGALVKADIMALTMPIPEDQSLHWAEKIFSLPLSSRIPLKNLSESACFGPNVPWGHQLNMPRESKILFKRMFDHDKISLIAYQDRLSLVTFFLIRSWYHGAAWFSLRGVHELVVQRVGSSLQLRRWSQSERASKKWAVFYFKTWEEMVLIHCSFIALKTCNALTVGIKPDEYKMAHEHRLFQAQILDDGFKHSLIVYRDRETNGLRLHAAVWEGVIRRCPVWSAFITHQSLSPAWLKRQSRHRVWLHDVEPYVFCQQYRTSSQRRSGGAFEIVFVSSEAATRFTELFSPLSAAGTSNPLAHRAPHLEAIPE